MSNIKVVSQYIKDLSFESKAPEAFEGIKEQKSPNIAISVNIDVKKLQDNIYEVILNLKITAKEGKLFICEIEYAGVFSLKNIEEERQEEVLLVYCPNLLFPFVRNIISTTITSGGFPTLLIDPIDFYSLYEKRNKTSKKDTVN